MHFKTLSDKALQKAEQLQEKRSILLESLSSNGPLINELIIQTKTLQQKVNFVYVSNEIHLYFLFRLSKIFLKNTIIDPST